MDGVSNVASSVGDWSTTVLAFAISCFHALNASEASAVSTSSKSATLSTPQIRLVGRPPQVRRSDFSLCGENRKDGEVPGEPLQSHRFRLAQRERAAKNCLNVLGNEDLIA